MIYKNIISRIVSVFVLMAMVFSLSACSGGKEDVPVVIEPTKAPAAETPVPTDTPEPVNDNDFSDGVIRTPYFDIQYPEAFADLLHVYILESVPYTVEFYALLEGRAEQRLFDITIGEGSDGSLGLVETADGTVPMGLRMYSFDPDDTWSEGETLTIQSMQDAFNEMVENLPVIEGSAIETDIFYDEIPEANITNYMRIRTSYCSLFYPVVWQDYLYVEQVVEDVYEEQIYKVHFYSVLESYEKQHIFSIYFGGDEGEQLGVIQLDNGDYKTVNLLMGEPNFYGMPDEDVSFILAMQDAVNQLIDELPLL